MKQVYRVWRPARPVDCYYLLAKSRKEAIEIVTLRLEDPEGSKAWNAEPDAPAFAVPKGIVADKSGKPIQSQEA